jgi:hypothetical protein
VRGEGRKILLDRLVIADVGEYGIEDGQLRGFGGHRNARLRHEREQPSGLEADGLAAGIGSADDELPIVPFKVERDRYDVPTTALEIAFQNGMPRVGQLK